MKRIAMFFAATAAIGAAAAEPPLVTLADDARHVILSNRGKWSQTEDLRCRWTALLDGVPKAAGTFAAGALVPGAATTNELPKAVERLRSDAGTLELRVRFVRDGERVDEGTVTISPNESKNTKK